ncbi:MAG TPA: PD-(D/E)XK nuclease family protein [Elusimicrobiales bacterium]|nr:PD-(D/E)XK nuclease family protein [Elusimicrobiales bacterium]
MFSNPYELNYSKVKTYSDCPILYKYKYVEYKRAPLIPEASLGISLHRALERYHKVGKKSLEALIDAYIDSWVTAGFHNAHQEVEFFGKGRKMLEHFWDYDKNCKNEIMYAEKRIKFTSGKWTIKGLIDRVDKHPDGSFEVIDYKSGFEIKTEKDVSKDFQLGIYALGLKKDFGIKVKSLSIYLLAYDKKITVPYDDSKESEILKKLTDTGEEMLKEDYKPNTQHCKICIFKKTCPFSIA